jgi:ferritin
MGSIKENVLQALHDQIQREHQASFLYRQAYFWFELNLFPGIAAFFKVSTSSTFYQPIPITERV